MQPSEAFSLPLSVISVLLGEDGGSEVLNFADTAALNKFLAKHGKY